MLIPVILLKKKPWHFNKYNNSYCYVSHFNKMYTVFSSREDQYPYHQLVHRWGKAKFQPRPEPNVSDNPCQQCLHSNQYTIKDPMYWKTLTNLDTWWHYNTNEGVQLKTSKTWSFGLNIMKLKNCFHLKLYNSSY